MPDAPVPETPSTIEYRFIGAISGARGLQGDLWVKAFDDNPSWVGKLKQVWMVPPNKPPVSMTVTSSKLVNNRVVIRLAEVPDRTAADKYRGYRLKVASSDLPALAEDEFYCDQLEGLRVISADSEILLGTVNQVVSHQDQDYLEITPAEPFKQAPLVPFQDVFVPTVNKAQGFLTVKGLDTLFE